MSIVARGMVAGSAGSLVAAGYLRGKGGVVPPGPHTPLPYGNDIRTPQIMRDDIIGMARWWERIRR